MNNTKRINSLKDRGFKVEIEHYRMRSDSKACMRHSRKRRTIPTDKINSKGGETHVRVISPKTGEHYWGKAICNSVDTFSYRLGTTIALNRVELAMNKDKGEE
jgi:hypothetical protein